MEWFQYLLEVNLYLALGFICFYLMLRKGTFYTFNRWYLIGIAVLSFLLPLCAVSWNTIATEQISIPFEANFKTLTAAQNLEWQEDVVTRVKGPLSGLSILLAMYFFVAGIFILKTFHGIFKIVKLYFQSPRTKENGVTHISLVGEQNIFSFFNWLFYHPSLKRNEAIMAHELVHINQRHSLDLLLFDLIIAVNWFNPIAYLMFKAVKINHEFIADGQASKRMVNKYEYAKLLINYVGLSTYRLGHPISSSSQLEQRIGQLAHKKSTRYLIFKSMLIIPFLVAVMVCFSAFTSFKKYKVFAYRAITSMPVEKKISSIDPAKDLLPVMPDQLNERPTFAKKRAAKKHRPFVTDEAKPKKRINALEVMYDWTLNSTGQNIRKIEHSIFLGTEAQLFRGEDADTLYVDHGKFKISGNDVEVMVDQLMIASTPANQTDKKLVVIDAKQQKVISVLPQVSIRTKGMIHEVRVDQSERHLLGYNMRIQYATVNAAQILVEKEDKMAPYQPGILW